MLFVVAVTSSFHFISTEAYLTKGHIRVLNTIGVCLCRCALVLQKTCEDGHSIINWLIFIIFISCVIYHFHFIKIL